MIGSDRIALACIWLAALCLAALALPAAIRGFWWSVVVLAHAAGGV